MDPNDEFYYRHRFGNDTFYAGLLHDHPELLDECCSMINMQWKRSSGDRLRSIGSSSNNFPTSIILIKESGKPTVIGHCKLSKIPHNTPVVFVYSVVVHPDFRGKGLGTFLMQKAERYLKCKNIKWIYLTTEGQESFYEKLGYSVCQPIGIYGSQLNNILEEDGEQQILKSFPNTLECNNNYYKEKCGESLEANSETKICHPSELRLEMSSLPNPPPPPPPPPPQQFLNNNVTYMVGKKSFMRKKII